MIQPNELRLDLQMELCNGVMSTTSKVWQVLAASKSGDTESVARLVAECPELIYAQYNYTPPIHFAAREGHIELVRYLLANGAHDPDYKIYPFQETLQTIAGDRDRAEIVDIFNEYSKDRSRPKFKGDNGRILYNRSDAQNEFEQSVYANEMVKVERILNQHPEFARDETYFWGEGILLFAAKENNRSMIDLLMRFGAKVPAVLKWTQFYYFEHDDGARYMIEKGMDPNTKSWQGVTILHDMAQKGNSTKVELLLKYGADLNPVDDEYLSTPLGMAARWGHEEIVGTLLERGADVNKAGALWATPLAWSRKKGFPAIENMLLEAGAK